jgi:hypothetical protein
LERSLITRCGCRGITLILTIGMSDYGDSDVGGSGDEDPGWEPKEECLAAEVSTEEATEPFQCCGTKNVYDEFGYRKRERVRRHVVEASASATAQKWSKKTWMNILTPYSEEQRCRHHWPTGKCDSCYHKDKEADDAEIDAWNEIAEGAERAEQEGYGRRRKGMYLIPLSYCIRPLSYAHLYPY